MNYNGYDFLEDFLTKKDADVNALEYFSNAGDIKNCNNNAGFMKNFMQFIADQQVSQGIQFIGNDDWRNIMQHTCYIQEI